MRREFILLLFGLWLGVAVSFALGDETEPNDGRIGSALIRVKGSDFFIVEYVAANSPAAEAGIKKGDFITSINGISTKGMSPKDAKDSIHGDIGSVLKLTVRREESTNEEVSITRRSLLDTRSVQS